MASQRSTITVGIRVRPGQESRGSDRAFETDEARPGALHVRGSDFEFNSVYEGIDNEALFNEVGRPLVGSVTEGYNSTLLTYGQTGSGKTFTMGEIPNLGSANEGVAHRTVRALYAAIAEDGAHAYEVRVTYVQIHCEHVSDLLGPKESLGAELHLHEDKKRGVFIDGVRRHITPSPGPPNLPPGRHALDLTGPTGEQHGGR